MTKEQIMKIPELAKIMTAQEIAKKYKVDRNTIQNWVAKLRKSGIKVEWGVKKGRKQVLKQVLK